MEKQNSAFSEFFRNASDEEKKRVYTLVAEKATQRQLEIIEESKKMNIEISEEARKLLAEEYERGGVEGSYPTYAKLALEGSGAFTMCSLRAIQRALDGARKTPR